VAWYQEWFGEEYLELYSHRDAGEAEVHIDFVERVLTGPRPNAVLDLACGAGRHTEVLRNRGYRALGVDISLTLLAQRPALPKVAGDMRNLPFTGETFGWVLNFFTSFGYFEEERENFRVLEEMRRILQPGGRFLIDLFNIDHVLANLVPRERRPLDGRPARSIEIERWYDPAGRRVNKRIRVLSESSPARIFLESVRAYRQEDVVIGMEWAGLEVTGLYGDFAGERFRSDSPRLILVGRKPA
jgi:SAM-dependent methyltransferase